MIGRYLEIGIASEQPLIAIGFYRDLGFTELSTGDIWAHPYAVVSDGVANIGVHGVPAHPPALTFVLPELADIVVELKARGVDFDVERTADDVFNELDFRDPDGNRVRIVEARTFSPAPLDECEGSLCGAFREIGLPVRDLESAGAFWERLGFETIGESDEPHPHIWMRGGGIVLGLHSGRDIDTMALSFHTPNLTDVLHQLDRRGIQPDNRRAPPGVTALTTPEDLTILLHGI